MKFMFFMICAIFAVSANAKTLTYEADTTQLEDANSLDICGYPTEFKMDQKAPIGPTFIEKALFTQSVGIENIQATEGSIVGGDAPEAFTGDYRDKVYLVKQVVEGSMYTPAIYYRVEIRTYGSTAEPSGFVVNKELLNHKYSAELTEGEGCGNIYYKLK